MNDRLQRALDGDLDRDDLTPAEAAELDESSSLFAGVLRSIPCESLPALGATVVTRIEAMDETSIAAGSSAHQPSRLISWLWSTRRISIQMRPAYALAAAAVFIVAIGIRESGPDDRSAEAPRVAVTTASPEVLVNFRLDAPNARSVSLAGDFSNWAPAHTMTRSGSGIWTVVVPLTPGVHDYSFIVDGEKWVPDPAAPAMADGFGGMNSRIAVLAPDSRRSL